DGSRLTYKRAFVRWLAKKPLNYLLVWIPSAVGLGGVIAVISAMNRGDGNPEGFVMAMITGMFVYFGLLALCSGVYWMAAFDPEKRALHDRVASTRVVKK
ncbi:MAG: RDD family protein, partial [Verrucomicrobiales bacterium]|nr:RDD family protein [Verrucomicrobiales bacterium]